MPFQSRESGKSSALFTFNPVHRAPGCRIRIMFWYGPSIIPPFVHPPLKPAGRRCYVALRKKWALISPELLSPPRWCETWGPPCHAREVRACSAVFKTTESKSTGHQTPNHFPLHLCALAPCVFFPNCQGESIVLLTKVLRAVGITFVAYLGRHPFRAG